jgi:hypothetical protein
MATAMVGDGGTLILHPNLSDFIRLNFYFSLPSIYGRVSDVPLIYAESIRPNRYHFVSGHEEHPVTIPIVGTVKVFCRRYNQPEIIEQEGRLLGAGVEVDVSQSLFFQPSSRDRDQLAVRIGVH